MSKTETMFSGNGEMYSDSDLSEAVQNYADNLTGPLPQTFTIYEQDFAIKPASYFLGKDFSSYLIERMDEWAYDLCGNEESIFPQEAELDNESLNNDLNAAIDVVFTKHGLQPKTMVAHGKRKEHLIEYKGQDDWSVIKEQS